MTSIESTQQVFCGNNIELLKQYPDNYFDSVVTDPPYGLGKEPNPEEMLKAWLEIGYMEVKGSGFMGKEWDAFVPQPIFWKEVFRVLKHGGHVVAFYGTRTYDWGVMAMRLAGFEVRDCIQWVYGCLSDDTEVLTRSGYIQYHKFKRLPNFEQQEILIYDIEKDIYKWEKPERWNDYNIHKDTCYRIESDTTNQIVSRNHNCLVEREGKLIFIKAEQLSEMEFVPTLSNDFLELQESKVLQSSMQRILSGSGLEETRTQGEESMVGRNEREVSYISNGREQSIVERRDNLSQKERILFRSQVEICEMSERVYSNGEEGWLCGGVSFSDGKTISKTSFENRVRTSHRPQSNEQRYNESNVICNKQGTQKIRVGKSYSTTLATITPIEYEGLIFCPTVSTGCFVARRKGKIFITGNSGFPKSHNISKAIDKMYGAEREVIGKSNNGAGASPQKLNNHDKGDTGIGILDGSGKEFDITAPASEEAKQWNGWGSALKPAVEPIVLARKPLEKGLSIAENVLKWGVGGINIDGCRVGYKTDDHVLKYEGYSNGQYKSEYDEGTSYKHGNKVQINLSGRFPANLILTHHPDCECKALKKVKSHNPENKKDNVGFNPNGNNIYGKGNGITNNKGYADENGEETIEDWSCHEDCPIRIMDEQSGILNQQGKCKTDNKSGWQNNYVGGGGVNSIERKLYFDKGGASRFFYVAKASKSERNKGLEGFEEKEPQHDFGTDFGESRETRVHTKTKNFHPTVKPIKLMQYLVRLVTPPNGIVLDPFCGSGTTGIACKLEGFDFIGLEQDPEYCKISEARINNYFEDNEVKAQVITKSQETEKKSKYSQGDLFS